MSTMCKVHLTVWRVWRWRHKAESNLDSSCICLTKGYYPWRPSRNWAAEKKQRLMVPLLKSNQQCQNSGGCVLQRKPLKVKPRLWRISYSCQSVTMPHPSDRRIFFSAIFVQFSVFYCHKMKVWDRLGHKEFTRVFPNYQGKRQIWKGLQNDQQKTMWPKLAWQH